MVVGQLELPVNQGTGEQHAPDGSDDEGQSELEPALAGLEFGVGTDFRSFGPDVAVEPMFYSAAPDPVVPAESTEHPVT